MSFRKTLKNLEIFFKIKLKIIPREINFSVQCGMYIFDSDVLNKFQPFQNKFFINTY